MLKALVSKAPKHEMKMLLGDIVKVGYSPSKKNCLLQWKLFKNDEKNFSFTLKAIFVLKIFKFVSWLFCHVEKTTWLER